MKRNDLENITPGGTNPPSAEDGPMDSGGGHSLLSELDGGIRKLEGTEAGKNMDGKKDMERKQGEEQVKNMDIDPVSRKRPPPVSASTSPEKKVPHVSKVNLEHMNGGQQKKAFKELQDAYNLIYDQMLAGDQEKKKMQQQLVQQQKLIQQQQQQLTKQQNEMAAMKVELRRLTIMHQGAQPEASSQGTSGSSSSKQSPSKQQSAQIPQRQQPQQQPQQQQQKQQQMQSQQTRQQQPQQLQTRQQQPQQPQTRQQQQQPRQKKQLRQQQPQQQQPQQQKQPQQQHQLQEVTDTSEQTWAQVVRRKPRGQGRSTTEVQSPTGTAHRKDVSLLKRRMPRGGAVLITKRNEEMTYTDVMRKARSNVKLADFGITIQRSRYTAQGEMLLEVHAQEDGRIDAFVERLKVVLGTDAAVRRPVRTTTLLVLDIEESVTVEEVQEALGPGEKRIYGFTLMGRGCRKAKVVVPIEAALRLLEEGRVRIGWSMCRVRSLETEQPKPLRCYKCLRVGHVAAKCEGQSVGAVCYRCGCEGHQSRACTAEKANCPVCAQENDRDPAHILGSTGCMAAAPKVRKMRQRK